jgi:uncharacterized protein (DUF58 family)
VTGVGVAAIVLLVLGTILAVPVAVILGTVVLMIEIVRHVWARFGLVGVTYRRRLERDRFSWGEEVDATIEIWNRKRLPLAWLRADDSATPGIVVRDRPLEVGRNGRAVMRNAWTLAPFERVTRHVWLGADRRGVFELGPVELSVGDPFAQQAAAIEQPSVDRFLVRPRTVPSATLDRRDTVGGAERTRFGLAEDPSRFAGVRDYAPGDPLRRMHPRASARLGRPVVKRFEPSREREVLIALDVQIAPGAMWETAAMTEEVVGLFVVAASLVRSLALERAAFGLAAAGYQHAESRFASVPVSGAPGQAERVFDLLARLTSHPSAPFEHLIGRILRTVRSGTTVIVVTARDPLPFVSHLRRLRRAGCPVIVLACGPNGPVDAARARSAGLNARSARLDGPWRTASRLRVTG